MAKEKLQRHFSTVEKTQWYWLNFLVHFLFPLANSTSELIICNTHCDSEVELKLNWP